MIIVVLFNHHAPYGLNRLNRRVLIRVQACQHITQNIIKVAVLRKSSVYFRFNVKDVCKSSLNFKRTKAFDRFENRCANFCSSKLNEYGCG